MPYAEAAACHWGGHGSGPGCGACANLAVSQRQFHYRGLDRLSRGGVLDDDKAQAAADGLSNRSRREVPARICAFRFPPRLLSDGAGGVIAPESAAPWLTGYIPDLPTPFDDEDRIDLQAMEKLCERQIVAGASALVVCETAGEASTLSMAERETIIR